MKPLTKENIRFEKKFIIDNIFNSLETIPKLNHLNLQKIYTERFVNSIYYDNDKLEFANHSVEGLKNKNKVRIRYYGKDNTNDIFLEIKTKKDKLGNKNILKIDKNRLVKEGFNLSYLFMNKLIPQKIINNLHSLKPVILISYNRNYYISKFDNYRITFDNDISFSSIDNFSDWNSIINSQKLKYNYNILEFKYIQEKELSVRKITSQLPFRLTSFSKYCIGLNEIGLIHLT